MGGTYVFDLESDGLLDEITKIHCMVGIDLASGTVHRFGPNDIRSGLDLISSAEHLIAHNGIGFDYPALLKLFPDLKLPKLTDTLIMSRMIYSDIRNIDKEAKYELPKNLFGRHSLESWGYRLGEHKGDFGKTTDWSEFSQEMLEYCEQDCLVTVKLYQQFLKENFDKDALDLEHQFATIITRQMERGWAFDEKAAVKLYADLIAKRSRIKDQMSETFTGWWTEMKTPEYYHTISIEGVSMPYPRRDTKTELVKVIKENKHLYPEHYKDLIKNIKPGPLKKKHTPFNPGSRHHIYRVFKEKYDWKPQLFTPKGDPKIDDDVLASLSYPEAKILAEYFLLDKRIGQLAEGDQAWLKHIRNGRIHGYVNTLGAVTHRCTHSNPNIAQVPACGAPYGEECRSLFKVSDGMVLVGADASGLELRCLAHYMSHWDQGDYAKVLLEGDIHTENQEAAGLPTRDNAKTFIYAFLYGAGDAKIGSIVGSGRKTGKVLRERFLKTLPALGSLSKTVKNAAKKGYIKGIDGRILKIRSEHSALNTLLQSAGAIVMKKACVNLDHYLQTVHKLTPGTDYEFVGNIHDEWQVECLPEHADLVGQLSVQAIRDAGDHFNFKCPLDGEYKKGQSWAHTH